MPTLVSSVHGAFDALEPPELPGRWATTLRIEPVAIAAPPEAVWRVLTDFGAYPTWCPFTRKVETDLTLGSPVHLHLCWKGDTLGPVTQVQTEHVSVVEPGVAIGWGTTMFGGQLTAERVQILEPHDGGTRYHTYDRFTGLVTPPMLLLYERRILTGFRAVGAALARRVMEGSPPEEPSP